VLRARAVVPDGHVDVFNGHTIVPDGHVDVSHGQAIVPMEMACLHSGHGLLPKRRALVPHGHEFEQQRVTRADRARMREPMAKERETARTFGEVLAAGRKELRWTQREMGTCLGVSVRTIVR
jgi:hypothetical protein